MKRFLLVPTLCFFLFLLSDARASDNKIFTLHEPKSDLKTELLKESKSFLVFELDGSLLQKIYRQGSPNLEIPITLPRGGLARLVMKKVSLLTPEFKINTSGSGEYKADFEKAIHYQGEVEGHPKSLAAFSFTSKEISGVFSFGTGNYNLGPIKSKQAKNGLYVLFNDLDAVRKNQFQCHNDELPNVGNKTGGVNHSSLPDEIQADNCRRVGIYFECDHKMYLDKGSSVPATVNWLSSLFNVVAAIYAQEGIVIRLSETFVHTVPDSYPFASSFEALGAFVDSVNTRSPFNGDLGHLLSTRPQANGGVAYLDVLCSKGLGYSNIYADYLPLPFYSWNVNVIAHELGHNFGSPHTQSCSWEISPGQFGILDSCFTAEDACYTGPRIAKTGTIMSYCHLMSKGIDLSLGFGPLPGALIRDQYFQGTCLSGTIDLGQITVSRPDTICTGSQVQISVDSVVGATYLWTGPNGFTSTLRKPTFLSITQNQAGLYSVIVTKGECNSVSLSTRLTVNCIYTQPLTHREVCLPASFEVDFVSSISTNPGNVYSVQLSNRFGNFTTPLSVGSVVSTQKSGRIQVIVPAGMPLDSGYKIRVVSSSPVSLGEAVNQTIKLKPSAAKPVAADVVKCQPSAFQLNASNPGILRWYSSATSQTVLQTGATFTTPTLLNTSSFWVESQVIQKTTIGNLMNQNPDTTRAFNTYHGLYIRVKRNISIDSITIYAPDPGILKFNVKDSANTMIYKSISIPVAGLISGQKIKVGIDFSPGIYRIDAEGSALSSLLRLNNFLDFPIQNPAMDVVGSSVPGRYYFFHKFIVTAFECPSERKEVKAIVGSKPLAPSASDTSRCGQGSIVFQSGGAVSGQSYLWYSTSTGLNPIAGFTGPTFTSPILSGNATYFVSIYDSIGCESDRTPIQGTILPDPASPGVANAIRCGPGSLVLQANGAVSSETYRWYGALTGFLPLPSTTSTYITGLITADSTLFVSIRSANGCESIRVPIQIVIKPLPNQPLGSDSSRCGSGSVRLLASGSASGETFRWYQTENATPSDSLSGGTTGSFISPFLNQSKTYYVAKVKNGCESQIRKSITGHINGIPSNPFLGSNGGFLIAVPDTVYEWYKDGNLISFTGDSLDLTVFGSGSYFVIRRNGFGCFSVSPVRIVDVTSIDETVSKVDQFYVYPNPGSGIFHVYSSGNFPCRVGVFEVSGKQLGSFHLKENQSELDLQSLSAGFYWLKMESEKSVKVIRIRKD